MQPGQQFDVNAFMNETVDAVLDTTIVPVPDGDHMGQIGTEEKSVDISTGVSAKNNRPWMRLDLIVDLTDPNLKAALKRDRVTVRHSVMLDLNEQGKLDMRPQRNVNLGKLRDAVNQNRPGAWSFAMLKGQPIKVRTKQRQADDGSGNIYTDVVAVAKAS
jgi:hypothetical protein